METYYRLTNSDFLKDAKLDYKNWQRAKKTKSNEYRKYVNQVSSALGLKGKSRFNTKRSPKFWTGKRKNPRMIIIAYNPGLGKTSRNPMVRMEEKKVSKNWKTYKKSRDNSFRERGDLIQKSKYYQMLYQLCCGLFENLECEQGVDWKFFHKNILNLNLFPFHSNKSENFPARFNPEQLAMIMHYVSLILEFIKKRNPKICLFTGKAWETLLIKHRLVDDRKFVKRKVKGKFYIYFFKIGRMKCVLFNHFITSLGHDKVNRTTMMKKIPNMIKSHYKTSYKQK